MVEYEIEVRGVDVERAIISVSLKPEDNDKRILQKNIQLTPVEVIELSELAVASDKLDALRRAIIRRNPVFQAEWNAMELNKTVIVDDELMETIGQTFSKVTSEEVDQVNGVTSTESNEVVV